MTFGRCLFRGWAILAVLGIALVGRGADLPPWTTSASNADDLGFSGGFAGIPAGGKRHLSRAALARLPGVKVVREVAVPGAGEAELTVLPLPELLKVLPLAPGADALVLVCEDRWESFVPGEMLATHRPYLLLYYNGKSPSEAPWPMFGGNIEALPPYYAYVSKYERPGYKDDNPHGMISATQIVEIRAVNGEDRYRPFYTGAKIEGLSELGKQGRDRFLRSCNVCHQGPGGVGGNVSYRPFVLLQSLAALNPDYFRKMVSNPKQFYPQTIMPKHSTFTEKDFAALIAFLTETREPTE